MVKRLGQIVFNWYLILNMALCAVLFAPWAKPRETISGFLGRMESAALAHPVYDKFDDQGIGSLSDLYHVVRILLIFVAVGIVDFAYFWEDDHCRETAKQEASARQALGYE